MQKMQEVENKIEALIQESVNRLLPLAGAAGMGYLGYVAGDDFAGGLEQASDNNTSILQQGLKAARDLNGEVEATPQDEFRKFLTPGQDGSWRSVGEAVGNQKLGDSAYYAPAQANMQNGLLRTGGALVGASLGSTIGQSLQKNKNR